MAKHEYMMDYIDDKDLFKAVMFATRIINQGKSAPRAAQIAGDYYDVDPYDVLHYLAQRSGRSQANRKYYRNKFKKK